MAIIIGTVPDAPTLAAFEATQVNVVRWVDIYQADNVTLWKSHAGMMDGNINVDSTRAERRNMDIILYDADNDLGYGPGQLWYDKVFKPYRGIQLPDKTISGFLYMPNTSGTDTNHLSLTRTALTVATSVEFAVKINPSIIGVNHGLAGWSASGAAFELQSTNKLFIQVAKASGFTGAIVSSVVVPGLTVGTPVWLRGSVTASTGVCSYWYSYDTTNDYAFVNWIALGTPQTGTIGAFVLTGSSTTYFGSEGATTIITRGSIYGAAESISSAVTIKIDCSGRVPATTSFAAVTGQTITLNSTGVDPARLVANSTQTGDIWAAPLGEFLADVIDRTRFPHTIHITGRDFVKKLERTKFGATTAFAVGTNVSAIINTIATNAGITKFNFASDATLLTAIATFDKEDTRWKAMSDLAIAIGMDLFFDARGYLTLQKFIDPLTAPVFYQFRTGVTANLVDYDRSTTDSLIRNHIICYGSSQDNALVWGEATNTTITSPTRIALFGEILDTVPNAFVKDNASAAAIALAILKVSGLEQYDVKTAAIVIPWMEGGVAVEMILPDAAVGDPTRFLWTDFTIPMALNSMSGTARRVTLVG